MTPKTPHRLISALLLTSVLLFATPLWSYPIPDTGQTGSYTDTFGEDSDYLINPPSYTKLDVNGNDLPDSAASWVMVRDNVTGLIWEVKTDDGSVHDKDNTYTWYDSNPDTNGGDAGAPGDGTDTEDFINALNTENFGGYSDWRLPTIKELACIVNYGNHSPAVDVAYFPYLVSSPYWSCTTVAGQTNHAWYLDFDNGGDLANNKPASYHVRAVRGGQSGSFLDLVINGDGTVTDPGSGLMWQQGEAESEMNWETSLSYCEALTLGGYWDWRLPNGKEIRSIVDYSVFSPALNTNCFLKAVSSDYWSSTTSVHYTGSAWHMGFEDGDDSYAWGKSSHDYCIRAVRGGQARSLGHLVISAPAQASIWSNGSVMPIRWDTAGIDGNVTISISNHGGKDGSFQAIVANTPNNGSYDWTVNVEPSVNCMLRVEPVGDTTKGTRQGLFSVEGSVPLAPTAETQEATGITEDSATLVGVVNPNGQSTTAVFQWGKDQGYASETAAIQGPLTGMSEQSVTANLSGLKPGQTYHFRVTATSSAGNAYGEDMTFTTRTTEIVRKAIIVAGSGPYETNYLWAATEKCAKYAYYALKDQGYTSETIHFLSAGTETDIDGDGIADVDNTATNANLEYALKTWALDADNLFIYLIGHGRYGEFIMGEWERLSVQDLDAWLDAVHDHIPDFVAVLYDACRSGSFLPDLLPPTGKKRVLVASSGPDEKALFSAEGDSSFGFHFFVHLHNGARFYDAFVQAKKSVEATFDDEQNPLLEADGNGRGNDKEDLDIALTIKVGLERAPAGEIPRIQAACPAQTLSEGVSEASIYASEVEGEGITEVYAIIKSPNYINNSPDDPVVNLPKIQLPPLGKRYQATYDGFTSEGTYNIAIFAKNEEGYLSLPVQTSVTTFSPCLQIADDVSIEIPCVEYQGNQYAIMLQYYPNPSDFLGYYWKLGSAVATEKSGCLRIGNDLSMTISCAEYGVTKYGFTLRYYPNSTDPSGIYWQMDRSTLEVK